MIKKIFDPLALGLEISGRSGNELVVSCPYHNDANPSAEYNIKKGLFYCFGCHTSKTAPELAEDLGGYLTKILESEIAGSSDELKGIEENWRKYQMNPLALGNEYLESRGVKDWQVEKHSIRTNGSAIIFEFNDLDGDLQGFQLRQLNRNPKYLFKGNKTAVWEMRTLLRNRKVVVVEGIFGALRAESFGIPAVATLGSSNVESVCYAFEDIVTKPYFLMDHDFAGFLAAGKYALRDHYVIIPNEVPPDELDWVDWVKVWRDAEKVATKDVNKIIESSPEPQRLQRKLEQYWEKIQ